MLRFIDILFSGAALLVLVPILICVMLLLKCSGEGEIFYLQKRVGRGGRIFKLFKFATMLKDSPNLGTGTVTVKDDPRILPTGKFLRKTKINELPQLINVLKGDMSLIGPRPLTPQTFQLYPLKMQEIILGARPGLSGIGSIIFRSEEEIMSGKNASIQFYENSIAPYKGALEQWFVSNQSLKTYFVLIILTVWAVLVPNTQLAWKILKDLPVPPTELKKALQYSIR